MRALSSLPSSIGASVWHADELACVADRVVATGHAALDAELPGGGWPQGALIELFQPAATAAVWPLLLPALAERVRAPVAEAGRHKAGRSAASARSARVVVVNPPHEPYLPALAAAGVPASRLLWLAAEAPAAQLWATEQALRCQDVAAVVAWLPRVQAGELRRLQQAAAQTGALLFALRPERAAQTASPARVRLRVAAEVPAPRRPRLQRVGEGDAALPLPDPAASLPALRVDLLKRRGPPLEQPLWLPVCSSAVWAVARAALASAHASPSPMAGAAQPPVSWAQRPVKAPAAQAPPARLETLAPPLRGLSTRARVAQPHAPPRSGRNARASLAPTQPAPEVCHALAGFAVAA